MSNHFLSVMEANNITIDVTRFGIASNAAQAMIEVFPVSSDNGKVCIGINRGHRVDTTLLCFPVILDDAENVHPEVSFT